MERDRVGSAEILRRQRDRGLTPVSFLSVAACVAAGVLVGALLSAARVPGLIEELKAVNLVGARREALLSPSSAALLKIYGKGLALLSWPALGAVMGWCCGWAFQSRLFFDLRQIRFNFGRLFPGGRMSGLEEVVDIEKVQSWSFFGRSLGSLVGLALGFMLLLAVVWILGHALLVLPYEGTGYLKDVLLPKLGEFVWMGVLILLVLALIGHLVRRALFIMKYAGKTQ